MKFEDLWKDYNFRNKCGLNASGFYRDKTFDFKEVKLIALHAYNAGVESTSQQAVANNTKVFNVIDKEPLPIFDRWGQFTKEAK